MENNIDSDKNSEDTVKMEPPKCLHPECYVKMFDGSNKLMRRLKVGDKLMGDDSTPRVITKLELEHRDTYTMKPYNYGMEYSLADSHMLSMRVSGVTEILYDHGRNRYRARWLTIDGIKEKSFPINKLGPDAKSAMYTFIKDKRQQPDYLKKGQEVSMTIGHYYDIPSYVRPYYRVQGLHKPIDYYHKPIEKDPYEFGYEIVNKLNLKDNNIPENYKYNTIDIRFELLAGILDRSAGYRDNEYDLSLKAEYLPLLQDIAEIARSLAMNTNIIPHDKTRRKKSESKGKESHYRLLIHGPSLAHIPSRLEGREYVLRIESTQEEIDKQRLEICDKHYLPGEEKPKRKTRNRDMLSTSMLLRSDGLGECITMEFEPGTNGKFLLSDFTVSGAY